jgi:hypothetical protein
MNRARTTALSTVFSSGSPVCYYVPGVPVVISATLSAVLAGWRRRTDRPWLVALAVSALSGFIATTWLVRSGKLRLFIAGQPSTPTDRAGLLRIWHRVNALRLLAASLAWLIAGRLASRICSRVESGRFFVSRTRNIMTKNSFHEFHPADDG